MKNKIPKLTLKAAKSLALREIGTAKGLLASEYSNCDSQSYEMNLGRQQVVITNNTSYFGTTSLTVSTNSDSRFRIYFNTTTLEENTAITQEDRQLNKYADMKELMEIRGNYISQLVAEYKTKD